jgi:uncharacterized protein (TIGR02186 family)
MRRLVTCLALITACANLPAVAADEGLVTQLATENVDITTHFTGEDILIFGAMTHPGDVIIKVVSPPEPVALSHKVAAGPFWLDGGNETVRGAPGLVFLLASRPIKDIVNEKERDRYGLRFSSALANAEGTEGAMTRQDWVDAFTRLKRKNGHYLDLSDKVKLVSNRLFFANIDLPATIPLGTYHLDIYLAKGGRIIGHQKRQLQVHQVRLERWVAKAARNHSWLFGIAFTASAMILGLLLGMVLRRDTDA